jgi:hypothetical protein
MGQESPRQVLENFCEMDADGKQLTAEGWRQIAALFTQARPAREKGIIVVKDFVVSNPAVLGDKVEFYVQYIYLGSLDESGPRLTHPAPLPPQPVKVRIEYTLSRMDEGPGPPAWKIDGSPREPHISVDTAIRYVRQLRAQATSSAVVKNADRTISSLKRLE